jgi:hypothetical protein
MVITASLLAFLWRRILDMSISNVEDGNIHEQVKRNGTGRPAARNDGSGPQPSCGP